MELKKEPVSLVQICYPVADGILWCNATHKGKEKILSENPNGKGYRFPCFGAKLKRLKKVEAEIATPLNRVAISSKA